MGSSPTPGASDVGFYRNVIRDGISRATILTKPYKHHKTQITSNYYKLIKLYKKITTITKTLKTIFLYYFKEMIDILDIA